MAVTSFAALTIGAAGITMRIYEMNKKIGIRQIDELTHIMHCGQEIYTEGRLSFESSDEICSVLLDFQLKIQEYGVDNVQIFIANSLTDAFNLDFLVTQIRIKTGMKAKILNNSKDHYLTLQSIAARMQEFNELIKTGTLILDVDYGNIQMTLYDYSELISTQSIPLGVARIREMVSGLEVKQGDYVRLISEAIQSDLNEFQDKILKGRKIKNFIVVGGEMEYLNHYVHKDDIAIYSREDMERLHESLLNGEYRQEMDEAHVRLLIPLFAVVKGFMKMTEAKNIYAPNVHLCDGMACDFGYKKLKIFSGHHFTEDRISTAIHLAKRFGCDMTHNLYVRDMAKILFKAVAKPFGLSNKDQQVLELATIMHNCGRFVNLHYEDDLSYTIVKESEFINLSDINRILVANVLRYKNADFPHQRDLNEPLVSQDFYVILARMTALFRLAEALDDCHLQKFSDVKVMIKNDEFVVRATTKQDAIIEIKAFEASAHLFQEVFGLKPVFKCKRKV